MATPENWEMTSGETYTAFLERISTSINDKGSEDMAAYWIDATQTVDDWDINAVIFANTTSPASVPVFGNLLLQSIA